MILPLKVLDEEIDGAWKEMTKGIKGLYGSLGKLMTVAMGIAAVVVLAMIVLRLIQGDQEGVKKLFWWLIGLAFGFVMLAWLTSYFG